MSDEGSGPLSVPKGKKKFGSINVTDSLAMKVDIPLGVVNGVYDGPTLAVTGGLFPTEFAGVEAASRIYQMIDSESLSGRLLVVPVVNMPVLQFRTPWLGLTRSVNPVDALGINSAFPGEPKGSITRMVAHTVLNDIILKSNYHVDLRGGDLNESHLVHTIYPRLGKDIDKVCEDMAKVAGFEYVLPGTPDISHTGRGSLVYEAAVRGVASMITESGLGYNTQPSEEEIVPHVTAVTNIMKHFGMIKGEPIRPKNQRFLDMTWHRVVSPVTGFFHALVDQGDILKEGQLIGKVTDLEGSELSRLSSPIDGVVHCMYPRRVVLPGDGLFTLLKIGEPTGW